MAEHTGSPSAPRIVTRAEWLEARRALLAEEKRFTRERDQLTGMRRSLPWVRVDKDYRFQGPNGPESLADQFDGCSQLIVYHFMFAPDWDVGCKSCSFWADHFDGMELHLKARDTALAAISRAPLHKLQAHARRLGWRFKWLSCEHSDFSFDFGVSFDPDTLGRGDATYNYQPRRAPADGGGDMTELPGLSVFCKDAAGTVFHTYSCYARGLDMLNGTYQLLDLTPKGRDEDDLPYPMDWVRLHDAY